MGANLELSSFIVTHLVTLYCLDLNSRNGAVCIRTPCDRSAMFQPDNGKSGHEDFAVEERITPRRPMRSHELPPSSGCATLVAWLFTYMGGSTM